MSQENLQFTLDFLVNRAGLEAAKSEFNQLRTIMDTKSTTGGMTAELREAQTQAKILETALTKAYNPNLGKLNTKAFSQELRANNTDINKIEASFKRAGIEGQRAFSNVNREMLKTGVNIKQSNELLSNMFTTLANTAKWTAASSAVNNFTGAIQRAVGFTKGLDESLNNIRVVSGNNTQEMEIFAKQANEAAKALGKSTTEYTDASLIFFQQGKAMEEVKALTEATLMGANVTGSDVADVADYLTAVMNGYNLEASKALETTDRLAAVGAATGSDFEELAIGMSKVASMANTVGVEIDSLNAMLATVTTVTREAPESVGTSFKTIFSRVAEVKAGKETEDGWTLGKVEKTIQTATGGTMSVLDDEGRLKDTQVIIEEIGDAWKTFNKESQIAIANAMAGQRQMNRLIALYNNWEMYQDAVGVSEDSLGATMEQNTVRMDSLAYKTQQLRAEWETLYMSFDGEDFMKGTTTALTSVLKQLNSFIDVIGGGEQALLALAAVATSVFSKQLGGGMANMYSGFAGRKADKNRMAMTRSSISSLEGDIASGASNTPLARADLAAKKQELSLAQQQYKYAKLLTNEEKQQLNTARQKIDVARQEQRVALEKEAAGRKLAKKEGITSSAQATSVIESTKKERAATKMNLGVAGTIKGALASNDIALSNKLIMNQIKLLNQGDLQQRKIATEMLNKFGDQKKVVKDRLSLETLIDEVLDNQTDALEEQNRTIAEMNQIQESRALDDVEGRESTLAGRRAEAAEAEANSIFSSKKLQSMLGGMTQLIGGVVGSLAIAGPSLKTFFDTAATGAERAEAGFTAFGAVASGVGLMLGGPFGAAVGMAVSALAKFAYENIGFNRIIKQNEKAIEGYTNNMATLKEDLNGLNQTQQKLNELETLSASGIDDTNIEQYVALQNEIATLTPQLIKYYDEEGNAVVDLTADVKGLTEAKKEQIRVENQQLQSNAGNLGLEYGKMSLEGKDIIGEYNEQLTILQEQLSSPYLTNNQIEEINTSITELQGKISESQKTMADLGGNIQQYIIQPFLEGDEVISALDGEMKEFVSNLMTTDSVLRQLEVGYTMYKETGSMDYIAQSLRDAQAPAKEMGLAMKTIEKGVNTGNKEFTQMKTNIKDLNAVSKQFVSDLSQGLNLSANMITKLIGDLKGAIVKVGDNKEGFIDVSKIQGSIDGLMEAKQKELDLEIKRRNEELTALEVKAKSTAEQKATNELARQGVDILRDEIAEMHKAEMAKGDMRTGLFNSISRKEAIGASEAAREQGYEDVATAGPQQDHYAELAIEQQLLDISKQQVDVQRQITEAEIAKSSLDQQKLQMQNEMNQAMNTYLFNVAGTVEGYELLRDTYNELTASSQAFFDSLDSAEDEGNFFFGLEEEIENIKDTLSEGINVEDTVGEYVEQFTSAFDKLPDEMRSRFEEMAEASGETLDGLVEKAKGGSAEATKALSNMVKQEQKEIGRLYAALNKDNAVYFQQFTKANKDQVAGVARSTGIMASDYSTLAEYKAALDKWETDNALILQNEQVKNYWLSANNIIGTAYQKKIEQAKLEGDMTEVARLEAEAQTSIASSAHWAMVVAKGEAEKETLNIVTQSIQQQMSAWASAGAAGDVAMQAAASAAMDELAKIQVKVAAIDGVIAHAKSQIEGLVAEAGGDVSSLSGGGGGSFGPPKPPPSVGGGDWNLGGGGAPPPPKPPTSNTGNSGPTVGGGGGGGDKGGGDKGKEEKEVEDMEWEADIYRDINALLERKSKLLSILQDQEDKLYGKELLDNLAEQAKLLKEQQALQEQKLKMQKDDAKNQAASLKKQGVKIDSKTGMILNYNDIVKSKVNAANSLSGEAKEEAIANVEKFIEALDKYEDLVNNSIFETHEAIQESIDAQREIFLQQFEFEIKYKIDISEDLQKSLDFFKDMNDAFEDTSENIEATFEQIRDQAKTVESLLLHVQKINNDDSLTQKEKIEMLEEYSDQLKDALKDLKALNKEIVKMYEEGLKDGLEQIKEHVGGFKSLNDELKHLEKLLKLIGEGDNYEALDEIYNQQYEVAMGQIEVLNKQKDSLEEQKKALEAAGMTGTDQWKAINEAIKNTNKDLNTLTEDSLKALQSEFKNTVQSIVSELDKSMTSGAGLDELKDQMKDLKDERKKYLDTEEKVLEISKLQGKIQRELDKTTDPAKKAKLQALLDDELGALKEKDKLTQYDVERANLLYDMTLKQMALEDQRATKNVMRLVRDTQGNWVYEFTEDAAAIQKAQDDLSASMEKLMELDKKKLQETQDEMIKLQEEYLKEVEKITQDAMAGKYKTEEEVRIALEEATRKYNSQMEELNAEYEEAKVNATISSMGVILDAYKNTGVELDGLTQEQQDAMHALADAIDGDYTKLKDTISALLTGDEDSIENALKELGLSAEDVALKDIQGAFDTAIGNMHEGWGTAITDMISQVSGRDGIATKTKDAVNKIMEAWKEYQDKMDEVKEQTNSSLDDIIDRTDDVEQGVDDLNDATEDLINTVDKEFDALTSVTTALESQRKKYLEMINTVKDYIKQIDELIRKKKEEANVKPPNPPKPTPPPKPPTTGGGSGSGGSGSGGSGGGNSGGGELKMGSKVKVKSGRRWYHDSMGMNPSGKTDPYAGKELQVTATNSKGKYPFNVGKTTGNYLGWLKKEDLVGFDTGGYTGSWGNSGKMAMLHEKEIVLNKEDTSNILDAVKLMRGISGDAMSGIADIIAESTKRTMQGIGSLISEGKHVFSGSAGDGQVIQNITIEADFSGVRDSAEIEKAFENLGNIAGQYAYRN